MEPLTEPLTLAYFSLPPKKKHYSAEEKALIVAKAAEVGIHSVADAYGFAWQTIASWKRYYAKKAPLIIIQSPSGQEITIEQINGKVSDADKIYVRADEGKAYWVKGEETGEVELW